MDSLMKEMKFSDKPLGFEPVAGPLDRGLAGGRDASVPLLSTYISMLRRRKWVVLGVLAAALLAGLAVTLLMTPRYTASATLEIQREDTGLVDIGENNRKTNTADMEFYQTQFGLLQSKSLAERVAVSLRLAESEAFFDTFDHGEAGDWFEDGRLVPTAPNRETRIREAGEILLKNVTIVPERLSRLVTIRFSSPDPVLSARVTNAWTQGFIESTIERRFEASSYARKFLEERLGQLRGRIDEAERRLVGYAAQESIINLPTATPADGGGGRTVERSLVAEDLVQLNQELARATADRISAQSRLSARSGAVNEALNNQALTTLRARRAELNAEYARLMVQFEPGYPAAQAIQTQIEQIERAIAREESRIGNTLQDTYQAAQQREAQLQQRVNGLKSGVLDLRKRSINYNILQRDADTNKELYDALLQRYKQIGVAGGVGVNNISVVDKADVPVAPTSPNLPFNLFIALAIGLLAGAGAALALEHLDHGLMDPTDVEKSFGIPLLGTIPRAVDADVEESLSDPKSWVSEAYMAVQTNLSFSTDHGVPRTLAITSTRASEGKSSTAFAIARAIVRQNRRVILIDGDMRSPRVHSKLGIENAAGLSNYLSGLEDYRSLIRSVAAVGLKVMTAGPQPPSAPELLSSDRFANLLSNLAGDFDHIIVDCPPVMGLADAPLIGSQVEGMVFVIEAQSTSHKMIEVALGRLQAARAQMLGIVVTKFDAKRASYGYGYEYGYGYGYGDKDSATRTAVAQTDAAA